MNEQFRQRLRVAAKRAFKDSSVVFAYLFGSTATGRARPGSDLDIAVHVDSTIASERYLDLSLELAGRLSTELGVGNVDVLVLNEAPLPVLGRAIQQRVVIYSRDEPSRVRFESRAFREFFDFQIHARPLDEKLLRDMAEGRR
jgi:hypothetical protein